MIALEFDVVKCERTPSILDRAVIYIYQIVRLIWQLQQQQQQKKQLQKKKPIILLILVTLLTATFVFFSHALDTSILFCRFLNNLQSIDLFRM